MRKHTLSLLFLAWLGLIALACNLTAPADPPTIAPRASATPPPTMGYATLSPAELPTQAATSVAQAPAVLPPVNTALVNFVNQVQGDRLMLHIDTLQNFQTRHVNSPANDPLRGIGAAHDYIVSQFEQIRADSQGRLTVFSQPFTLAWAGIETQPQNVVAVLTGTEPGAGTLMIGAHYDSISIDYEDGSVYAPGANDNASGVAAVIELARVLSTRQHRASIMFVAFSAEEVGRRGSIAFAQDYLLSRQVDVFAMLNLDIIGSFMGENGAIDDRNIRLFSEGPNDGSVSRELARMIELIGTNHVTDLTIRVQDMVDREGRYGDHMSFSELGFPAVRFTQGVEDRSRQHNERDTIDGVQASYLTDATRTVLTIATALADGPRPPVNISLRDAGNGTRTLVWEPVPDASGYVVALRRPGSMFYEQFEVSDPNTTSITWDGFVPERFATIAIAVRDRDGLMGPLSAEYWIP